MHRDVRQRARLRRVDEIFRRFLAATRAKFKLGDDELLNRAEQGAQSELHAHGGRPPEDEQR